MVGVAVFVIFRPGFSMSRVCSDWPDICLPHGAVAVTVAVFLSGSGSPACIVYFFSIPTEAPTARFAAEPMFPSLSSVTWTFVRAESPVFVTLNLYVTSSPTSAEAGPDFSIFIPGLRTSSEWSSTSLMDRPHAVSAVTVAVFFSGSGSPAWTVYFFSHSFEAPAARLANVPISPSLSSVTFTLVSALTLPFVTVNL